MLWLWQIENYGYLFKKENEEGVNSKKVAYNKDEELSSVPKNKKGIRIFIKRTWGHKPRLQKQKSDLTNYSHRYACTTQVSYQNEFKSGLVEYKFTHLLLYDFLVVEDFLSSMSIMWGYVYT